MRSRLIPVRRTPLFVHLNLIIMDYSAASELHIKFSLGLSIKSRQSLKLGSSLSLYQQCEKEEAYVMTNGRKHRERDSPY